jgi:L-fuconolactonase
VTRRPPRIVDAHVHLWDPARTDWYPYLSGRRELDLGEVTGMARLFDVATYLAESDGWNVEKIVNVAAATGGHSIDETLELDRRAEVDRYPHAIVGGLPPTDSTAEAIELLETQMSATRFRGVRPMGPTAPIVPPAEVLQFMAEHALVFELMAHPDQFDEAARGLAGIDDLTIVVEHTGWPRSGSAEEFALWQAGTETLAGLGDDICCKLSGLAMPLAGMAVEDYRPWIDHAIDVFGVDRCMFASNFPVDGLHGTWAQLYSTFAELTDGLDDTSRDKLFAANAERIYRC